MSIDNYILIARSLVKLMNPLLEVVIHDLVSGEIIFIEGGFSKRKIGDPSLLEAGIHNWQEAINQELYPKISFDGRLIKSISIPINENGKTTFLLCINCDVSVFKTMKDLADTFCKDMENEQPSCLFKNDYQERVHAFLYQILKEKGWRLETLRIKEKRELVRLLFDQGAFNEKNAAEYIAKLLNMGRATIFNYLKERKRSMQNES